MLPQFAWGASQNANAPPPTSPASQDANAQEHPYNGDDATRPLNLLQLRYTYKTAPGTTRSVSTHTVTLRADRRIDLSANWQLDFAQMFTETSLHSRPRLVGIEGFNFSRELVGFRTEILLKDRPIVIDNKCHDARIPVFCWRGDEREAAYHLAFSQVIVGAPWRVRSLPGQNMIVVSVIRDRGLAGLIAFIRGLRGGVTPWARWLPFCSGPIKAVFVSCPANDSLGVYMGSKPGWIARGVFIFCLNIREAYLNCR